jgi:hypothetical protein
VSPRALRQLRATRRAALKSRTQAANLLLTAPADLRAEPSEGALKDIVHRLHPAATWTRHPGTGGGKFALRSAARRWRHLAEEIAEDMTDGFVLSPSAPSGEPPSE